MRGQKNIKCQTKNDDDDYHHHQPSRDMPR